MIDLREPTFTLCGNPSMRLGYCAVVKDDHVIYAGPIRNCPGVVAGCELFMHPKDCESLDAHMKKQLN
jgi:hypothetical protein